MPLTTLPPVLETLADLISITVLPATLAIATLFVWSLGTILLGVGSDFSLSDWFSMEQDWQVSPAIIGQATESTQSTFSGLLLVPIRWLNAKEIPLVLWGGIFSICWWAISIATYYCIDVPLFSKTIGWGWAIPIIARNVILAALLTKALTRPMRSWFEHHELHAKDLVGSEVVICSYEASSTHGQAKYKTGSAPLLLNVKSDGPILPKGTKVWITHYDATKRIYQVSATTTSSTDNSHL